MGSGHVVRRILPEVCGEVIHWKLEGSVGGRYGVFKPFGVEGVEVPIQDQGLHVKSREDCRFGAVLESMIAKGSMVGYLPTILVPFGASAKVSPLSRISSITKSSAWPDSTSATPCLCSSTSMMSKRYPLVFFSSSSRLRGDVFFGDANSLSEGFDIFCILVSYLMSNRALLM